MDVARRMMKSCGADHLKRVNAIEDADLDDLAGGVLINRLKQRAVAARPGGPYES
jgi:hypothetical protein